MHASDLLRVAVRRWQVFLPIACLGPAMFLLARSDSDERNPGWTAAAHIDLRYVPATRPTATQGATEIATRQRRARERLHDPLESARVEWDAAQLLTGGLAFTTPQLQTRECEELFASLQGVFPSAPEALRDMFEKAVRLHVQDSHGETLPVEVVARRGNPDEALALSWAYAEAIRLSHTRFLRSLATGSATRANAIRVEVADRAVQEAAPNRSPLHLVFVISLTLAFAAAVGVDRKDQRLVDPTSASAQLGLPLLGVIPGTAGTSLEFARGVVQGPVIESLHDCAAALRQVAREQEISSFAITSAVRGEGKSSLLGNIGRLLARKGLRVLLVDCHPRHPRLHTLFGLENSRGFSDLVEALAAGEGDPWARIESIDADVVAVRQATTIERLLVITAGNAKSHQRSPFEDYDIRPLVLRLARDADIVLYDTPALSVRLDALDIGRAVERTVLVVDSLQAQKTEAQRAKRLLVDGQATVAGMLFNRAHPKHSGASLGVNSAQERRPLAGSEITERSLTNAGA
jgi:protein-tyrosine kinase